MVIKLDNFAHIGGWIQGFLLSVVFIPIISQTKKHRVISFILRLIALAGSIVLFIVREWKFSNNSQKKRTSY